MDAFAVDGKVRFVEEKCVPAVVWLLDLDLF